MLDIEKVREICLAVHPQVTEDVPFATQGFHDVAFRICDRIFAFLLVDDSRMVVMKCDPDVALELRDRYVDVVQPAWHWNKRYWNQVHYDADVVSADFMRRIVRHSFDEVVKKLPRKTRQSLGL